jgi:hypothetical protein
MLRIGVLIPLGWKEGRNLEVSFRWATNDAILTRATPATAAVMRETSTIPIVFVNVSDLIGARCFFTRRLCTPGGRDGIGGPEHDRKADLARGSITVWAGSDLRGNAMRSL